MLTQDHFSSLTPVSRNLPAIAGAVTSRLIQPPSLNLPSLTRSAQPLRAIGRTLGTARLLGLFPGRRTVRANVGRQNANFFRFTLNELSNLRLTFRNRSQASIVGSLLNEQGQLVSLGRNRLSERVRSGETLKRAYQGLPSGTYYLRLNSRAQGRNAYQLTLAVANTRPNLPCGCGG
ncbi:hypothetical protein [Egbenema bharatensis]|uniref:hypothetical protein n=1 Tax=Egbenema bharatensis TaxID=3463334 RepID=UPI003A8666E3